MRIVGIDPGLKGAIACVETDDMSVVSIHDMPTTVLTDDRLVPDAREIQMLIEDCDADLVIIEHVEPRPGSGRTSEWRFAQGFGATLAAAQLASDAPRVALVRPRRWKRDLDLDSDKDKSLSLAREIFPDAGPMLARKKDDGRAEALLLVHHHVAFTVPANLPLEVF